MTAAVAHRHPSPRTTGSDALAPRSSITSEGIYREPAGTLRADPLRSRSNAERSGTPTTFKDEWRLHFPVSGDPAFPVTCGQTPGHGVRFGPVCRHSRETRATKSQALAREPQEVDSPAAARVWGTCQGLAARTGAGSRDSGRSWYATPRRKRLIAAVPTEVPPLVVAGQGPPCSIAGVTATPVGQPLTMTRPARVARVWTSARSSSLLSPSASWKRAGQVALEEFLDHAARGPRHRDTRPEWTAARSIPRADRPTTARCRGQRPRWSEWPSPARRRRSAPRPR